jgi:hypothetical protein
VFENVLRKESGLQTEEVIGGCYKHSQIKEDVMDGETKNAFNILIRKPEEKRPL